MRNGQERRGKRIGRFGRRGRFWQARLLLKLLRGLWWEGKSELLGVMGEGKAMKEVVAMKGLRKVKGLEKLKESGMIEGLGKTKELEKAKELERIRNNNNNNKSKDKYFAQST